jgi:hypothetical protein
MLWSDRLRRERRSVPSKARSEVKTEDVPVGVLSVVNLLLDDVRLGIGRGDEFVLECSSERSIL